MLYSTIFLGCLSSLVHVATANLVIDNHRRNHDDMKQSLVDQAEDSSAPIVQPNFEYEEGPCTCECEVEPGTAGVVLTIEGLGDKGGKEFGVSGSGQVLNFCVPIEYEEFFLDLFEQFENIPQVTCAPSDACPDDSIPVPLPDPSPECECTCEIESKEVQEGVIVTAAPWLFHLCIPASWSAFFLVVPSIVTPILQLPSTDFTCASPDEKGEKDEKRGSKGGCPTKLVIPVPLPAFPEHSDVLP